MGIKMERDLEKAAQQEFSIPLSSFVVRTHLGADRVTRFEPVKGFCLANNESCDG